MLAAGPILLSEASYLEAHTRAHTSMCSLGSRLREELPNEEGDF